MFDDGKTEPRTANTTIAGLGRIPLIEPLKDSLLLLNRNAKAGVAALNYEKRFLSAETQRNVPPLRCEFNSIVNQVLQNQSKTLAVNTEGLIAEVRDNRKNKPLFVDSFPKEFLDPRLLFGNVCLFKLEGGGFIFYTVQGEQVFNERGKP